MPCWTILTLRLSGSFKESEHPDPRHIHPYAQSGPVLVGPGGRPDSTAPRRRRHTIEVLEELGYSQGDIARLVADGDVKPGPD